MKVLENMNDSSPCVLPAVLFSNPETLKDHLDDAHKPALPSLSEFADSALFVCLFVLA